jgi:hypothetical protein
LKRWWRCDTIAMAECLLGSRVGEESDRRFSAYDCVFGLLQSAIN